MQLLTFATAILHISAAGHTTVIDCDQQRIAEILLCNQARYERADEELNRSYRETYSSLTDEQKTALRDVQRAWVSFKESYCNHVHESILPGQEAHIEKAICLWKATDDRTIEISRIGKPYWNDAFLNFVLSLQDIGYSRDKVIHDLANRYGDDNEGWNRYATMNCEFMSAMTGEDRHVCVARLNAQRGSN